MGFEKRKPASGDERQTKRPRSRLLRNMFISYFAIILISLLLYYFMYNYASESIKKYVLSAGQEAQLRASSLIGGYFNDAESMLWQLSQEPKLRSFASRQQPLAGADYAQLGAMHKTINKYKSVNSIYTHILLYYENSDVLCSDSVASARVSNTYYSCIAYDGMSKDEWLAKLNASMPAAVWQETSVGSGKSNVISYVRSFPTNSLHTYRTFAVVQIDSKYIHQALEMGLLAENTHSYIIDENHNVVLSGGAEMAGLNPLDINLDIPYSESEVNGRSVIAFATPLSFRGMTCVTVFDMDSLMVKTTSHRSMLLSILAFALFAELIYAVIMTRFNYRPIKSIISLLPEGHGSGAYANEYAAIRNSISRLNTENSRMHRKIDSQEDLLQSLRISRLLGYEPGLDSLDVHQIGLPGTAVAYMVFVLGLRDGDDSRVLFRSLSYQFDTEMKRLYKMTNVFTLDYALDRTAFIVPLTKDDVYENVVMVLLNILAAINASPKDGLIMGIGTVSSDIDGIGRSFSEARLAMQQASTDGKDAELYANVSEFSPAYDYSSEMETKLQQLIISGNSEEALALTNSLYWKCRDTSSAYRLRVLINSLYGTLLRIRQMNLLKSQTAERQLYFRLNEIEFNTNILQRFSAIQQTILFYCESITAEHQSASAALWSKVNDYINEHYSDPDLCLDSIGDAFNVSAKYLSRCFKEQTQNNLSTTITNIRMNHAKLILETEDVNIEQLALMCGYRSPNTFYKAFKRTWGVSPSDYREFRSRK